MSLRKLWRIRQSMAHHYGDFYPNYKPKPLKKGKNKTNSKNEKESNLEQEDANEVDVPPPIDEEE
jgi:hypothetical protein